MRRFCHFQAWNLLVVVLSINHVQAQGASSPEQLAAELKTWSERIEAKPDSASAYLNRGMVYLAQKELALALSDFDRCLEIAPERKPELWQRGIALYYAGKYKEGAAQFETHHAVNPDDVENSVWHFLCKAKTDGLDTARTALIPSRGDGRYPMMLVLEMFRGEKSPQEVMNAVEKLESRNASNDSARFFAHLYVGLYYRAHDDRELANEHLSKALEQNAGGYMADIARIDLDLSREPSASQPQSNSDPVSR